MSKNRRLLSAIAGRADEATRAAFKGVFTADTLPLASNLSDLNIPNLFFVHVDGYFILVFNTSTQCIVVDGRAANSYPDSINNFINLLSGGENDKVTTLPFKMIDGDSSMSFSLLFAVYLCSTSLTLDEIVVAVGLKKNEIAHNKTIVNSWFKQRYHIH